MGAIENFLGPLIEPQIQAANSMKNAADAAQAARQQLSASFSDFLEAAVKIPGALDGVRTERDNSALGFHVVFPEPQSKA